MNRVVMTVHLKACSKHVPKNPDEFSFFSASATWANALRSDMVEGFGNYIQQQATNKQKARYERANGKHTMGMQRTV